MSSVAVDVPHAPAIEFSIRGILRALWRHTPSLAGEMAVAEDATLTLVHMGKRRMLWDHSGIAHPAAERLRTPARCRICRFECKLGSRRPDAKHLQPLHAEALACCGLQPKVT